MKKLKCMVLVLSIGIILGSCAGDDGEPGPVGDAGTTGANGATGATGALGQGLQKAGYVQGTAVGKRTDGTPFSESFTYEYGSTSADVFRDQGGSKYLDLYRTTLDFYSNAGVEIYSLKLSGSTLVVDANQTNASFKLTKELSVTDLFLLSVQPYFKNVTGYVLRLSDAQNKVYHFNVSNMNIDYHETQYETGNSMIPVYGCYVYAQTGSFLVYYRKEDGTLLTLINLSNGNAINSGDAFDLYNRLTFKNNPEVNALTFYDKATTASLHTVIPDIAADQLIISNYHHDATSGVVSFDYVLKVSAYRSNGHGVNTSGNDLTITGSFNSGGKIYKTTSGRTSTGG